MKRAIAILGLFAATAAAQTTTPAAAEAPPPPRILVLPSTLNDDESMKAKCAIAYGNGSKSADYLTWCFHNTWKYKPSGKQGPAGFYPKKPMPADMH